MRLTKLTRVGVFVACLGMSGGLVAAASGATGAYFSDSEAGTFSGSLGSIKIDGSGGGGDEDLDFEFEHILPGETRSAAGTFANTGLSPQDVWITFPDAGQLLALNTLGTYGAVRITADGVEKFYSTNLKGGFGCNQPIICAVPGKLLLFSNLPPNQSRTFTFEFTLASKTTEQPNVPVAGGLDYLLVGTQVGIEP